MRSADFTNLSSAVPSISKSRFIGLIWWSVIVFSGVDRVSLRSLCSIALTNMSFAQSIFSESSALTFAASSSLSIEFDWDWICFASDSDSNDGILKAAVFMVSVLAFVLNISITDGLQKSYVFTIFHKLIKMFGWAASPSPLALRCSIRFCFCFVFWYFGSH